MSGASYTTIRVDRRGHIAEVVLNRPSKLNTMNKLFFEEIRRVFEEISDDADIRVAIIWAEGKMFSAGLDLKEAAQLLGLDEETKVKQASTLLRHIKELQESFTIIQKCKKPVVVAVHGDCIGGGLDLVCACDIRICTENATFCVKETKVAIVADVGSLQRLPKIVSKSVARKMAFTGDPIPSSVAKSSNLVSDVYETKEKMLVAARELAQTISENSPLVVQGAKLVMNFSDEHSVADGLEHVSLFNSAFLHSEDLQEAFMSFLTKKKPLFRNNL